MSPKRILLIAGLAAAVYIGFAIFVFSNFDLPEMGPSTLAWVGLAAVLQISSKWPYGLLFRESAKQVDSDIRPYSAFRAALVGAGVARLIPAGGAITPVAMSWTVRDEAKGTAGAALRTVLLNYSAMVIMTGAGLLLARPNEGAQIASISLTVLAPIGLVVGIALMFGSGMLGTISRFLPRFLRERLESSVVNHLPGLESQFYIWSRLGLEAAALGIVLNAFGIEVGIFQTATAFGVGSLVGGLPGTPGGMGVTEAGLVLILEAYGFAAGVTLAPILVFRLVSYWVPAALGFMAGGMTFIRSDAAQSAVEEHDGPRRSAESDGEPASGRPGYPRRMRQTVSFELPNQDLQTVSSSDFAGSKLIMFFYPKAMTAGCTTEACDFRDNYTEFLDAGYEIVGVSPDPPERNARFREKEQLNFDLLSDEDHRLAESLGAWGEKKSYGKVFEGLIRSTFVIGPDGAIEKAYRNVRAKGHVDRVRADLLG